MAFDAIHPPLVTEKNDGLQVPERGARPKSAYLNEYLDLL
jgi:hypothetical protein